MSRRFSWQTALLAGVLLAAVCGIYGLLAGRLAPAAPGSRLRLDEIPFDGAQAYDYLQQLCALGPRVSGTQGMAEQQALLERHFGDLGGQVEKQAFRARHPADGSAVQMTNLIVRWHPDRSERILLCAHYDTRPFPDRDPTNPQGMFLGANDGGSGVALLMELGRGMGDLAGELGVDFVFFDGEELVLREGDPYFLGSEHFAREHVREPACTYRWGVLLDMVADADLQIYQERNSLSWRETRPLVQELWGVARRLGVREFIARPKYEIRDDHLALRNIGRIPTCDVIDFDYPAWHTEADLPEQCSALSLAKVGWVVEEWLRAAVRE